MIAVAPAITGAIALGPINQVLNPLYRFVGDDWDDENQFLFTFYTVLPTFDANGNPLTAGQVRDLSGCTFSGMVSYRPRTVAAYPIRTAVLAPPIPMVGVVNVPTGQAALTLSKDQTGFPKQDRSLWTPTVDGFENGALLEVQARLTDSFGVTSTKGIIPLFVF